MPEADDDRFEFAERHANHVNTIAKSVHSFAQEVETVDRDLQLVKRVLLFTSSFYGYFFL